MIDVSLERELRDRLVLLDPSQQRQVLEYARSLSDSPHDASAHSLLRFAGIMPAAEVERIARAVTEGCERVDPGDW